MSTGYCDYYEQHEDKRWSYRIMDDEHQVYNSCNNNPIGFASLEKAEEHCKHHHANSGSSSYHHYFDSNWDLTDEATIELALSYVPSHFFHVDESLPNYRSLVIKFIKQYCFEVFNVSRGLRTDREVILLAYEDYLEKTKHIPKDELSSFDNPLRHISPSIKSKIGKNDPLMYLIDGIEEDCQVSISQLNEHVESTIKLIKNFQELGNQYAANKSDENLKDLKKARNELRGIERQFRNMFDIFGIDPYYD